MVTMMVTTTTTITNLLVAIMRSNPRDEDDFDDSNVNEVDFTNMMNDHDL